jgi:hypothetical protein
LIYLLKYSSRKHFVSRVKGLKKHSEILPLLLSSYSVQEKTTYLLERLMSNRNQESESDFLSEAEKRDELRFQTCIANLRRHWAKKGLSNFPSPEEYGTLQSP